MAVASLVPVWAAEFFPSQNGPMFLLVVHVLKELHNPEYAYDQFYAADVRFIPHLLHSLVVLGLSYAVPLLTAHRLALSLYVLLMPASAYYFLRAVAPRNVYYAALGFLFAHTFCFYRGYHNFCLSVPLCFLLLGYWFRYRRRLTVGRGVLIAVGCCVACLAHLLGFLMFGFIAGMLVLLGRRRVRGLVQLALCVLPCCLLVVHYLLASRRRAVSFLNPEDVYYESITWQAGNLYREFLLAFSHTAALVTAVPLLVVLWLAAVRLGRVLSRIGPRREPVLRVLARNRGLVAAIVLLALYFAMPTKLLGWHRASVRMLPFFAVMLLAGAAPLRKPRFRVAFVGQTCLCTLASCGILAGHVRTLGRAIEQQVALGRVMEPRAVYLAIRLENPRIGSIRPMTQVFDYYGIWRGGISGQSVAALYPTIVPIRYREYPVTRYLPRLPRRDATAADVRWLAPYYDYLLVLSYDEAELGASRGKRAERAHDAEVLDALRRSGLKLVFDDGRVRIYGGLRGGAVQMPSGGPDNGGGRR